MFGFRYHGGTMQPIPADAAAYMAKVAKLLTDMRDDGKYHVQELIIGYDGDRTGYKIVPDEFGGYGLVSED